VKKASQQEEKATGQISLVLPTEQLRRLRILADATDCSIGDLVRRGVSEWFSSDDFQTMLKRAEESAQVSAQVSERISNLATMRSNVSEQSEK
jgi:hypothetical protein